MALPVGHGFLCLLAVSPRKVAGLEASVPPMCMVFEFHYIDLDAMHVALTSAVREAVRNRGNTAFVGKVYLTALAETNKSDELLPRNYCLTLYACECFVAETM
ncbi:hypothetical protein CONLIGDRAFT_648942 [Coniochaeta ligniaria NRRL 30616]|uniref:Uncharacterized protein n=1 Tax=Coniochaeta ligniaria NRRL 30616 TaxID=1408157 RepID=A0A1J7IA06_9PEZI|nr:hypothetical protein CONLIGDRAFT_648942 [Coniochaeta ligniaria NRRL 30616]